MTVIINEFELVVESQQPAAAPEAKTPPPKAPTSPLNPNDIMMVQRRHKERLARVWAT